MARSSLLPFVVGNMRVLTVTCEGSQGLVAAGDGVHCSQFYSAQSWANKLHTERLRDHAVLSLAEAEQSHHPSTSTNFARPAPILFG